MKQLESVQALRGIAALLVFMGHLIAIAASALTYEMFEKPLLNGARKLRAKWFDFPANPTN